MTDKDMKNAQHYKPSKKYKSKSHFRSTMMTVIKKISFDKEVEKLEPSYIAGGNAI